MSTQLSVDRETGFAPLAWGNNHQQIKANAIARMNLVRHQEGKRAEPVEMIIGDMLVRGFFVESGDRN